MSRIHLLDTNILRAWVDGEHEHHDAVVDRVRKLGDALVFLSVVTIAEVEYGLARPHRLDAEVVAKIRGALVRFSPLEIDQFVTEPYGQLRAWLVDRYAPKGRRSKVRSISQLRDPTTDLELGIQENDLWLASQAIATDSILVTGDQMARIVEAAHGTGQDLRLERWYG
jgi:predicted nucleic acid-binding protein